MRQPISAAVVSSSAALVVAAVCALIAGSGPCAQAQSVAPGANPAPLELYRKVKVFDFDERRLGNYEETPMYWRRLAGPGLPAFSSGRLDERVGHDAAPSFLLVIQGGSVAYEYAHTDLTILPNSDYVIEGYVRAEGLEHARALLTCYLVDESGRRIVGSDRVSAPVMSLAARGGEDEPWQRVQIDLPGEYPDARALRLQLWVLQTHVFSPPAEGEVDPIVHQEVDARVWFDDIAVIRMPRVRLGFSRPGNLVKPPASESLRVEVHNATLTELRADVAVSGADGRERLKRTFALPAGATEDYRIPLPTLPVGMYRAEVWLRAADEVLVQRTISFAVLPEWMSGRERFADFGIDLGPWPGGDADGATELITALGCGAVKVGLPMFGAAENEQRGDYIAQLRELARHLAISEISSTGVLLSPAAVGASGGYQSTYRLLTGEGATDERLGPIFAHYGGHLASWQLGYEAIELQEAGGGWTPRSLKNVQENLKRFVAVPQLVIPRSILDGPPTPSLLDPTQPQYGTELPTTPWSAEWSPQPYAYSYWLPAGIPAQAIPWQLSPWFAAAGNGGAVGSERAAFWISLGLDHDRHGSPAARLADMARRVVLAKTVGPDRLYVPAPFELSDGGGAPQWQPNELYIPLRALAQALSGTRALAAMPLEHDGLAVVFGCGQQHKLVAWTWRLDDADTTVKLYVGKQASALDLHGARWPLSVDGLRAAVPLRAVPLIVEDVDAALLLLQNSFRISPAFVQLHDPQPRPVLYLRNTYNLELSARIELHPPAEWQVLPNPVRVLLAPGETLAQPLEFIIPPRTLAIERKLGVDVYVRRPDPAELHFDVGLEVGLKDVQMSAAAWWDDDALLIEQTVRNLAPQPLSFNTFCQPPGRARLEGVLLNIPPGEARVQRYRLPTARALAGAKVWVGLDEVAGRRTLDQLVAVPSVGKNAFDSGAP